MSDYIYREGFDMDFCCGGARIRTDDRNILRMNENYSAYSAFYQGYLDELFAGGFPELALPGAGAVLDTINNLTELLNNLQPGAVDGNVSPTEGASFVFVTVEQHEGALGWGIRVHFHDGERHVIQTGDVIADYALWDVSTSDYTVRFEHIYPLSRFDFFRDLAPLVGYDETAYPVKFDALWLCCMAAKNSYANMMWYSGLNRTIREAWGAVTHRKGTPPRRVV